MQLFTINVRGEPAGGTVVVGTARGGHILIILTMMPTHSSWTDHNCSVVQCWQGS